jgi:hypothetical protein
MGLHAVQPVANNGFVAVSQMNNYRNSELPVDNHHVVLNFSTDLSTD